MNLVIFAVIMVVAENIGCLSNEIGRAELIAFTIFYGFKRLVAAVENGGKP